MLTSNGTARRGKNDQTVNGLDFAGARRTDSLAGRAASHSEPDQKGGCREGGTGKGEERSRTIDKAIWEYAQQERRKEKGKTAGDNCGGP